MAARDSGDTNIPKEIHPAVLMEEATLMRHRNVNATAQQQQDHVSIDVHQLEEFRSTIQHKLHVVTKQSKLAEETPVIIPRVPINPGEQLDFEPRIISIGPYYWGQPRLRSMDEQKLLYVDAILKRDGARPLKDYLESLMKLQDRVRTSYTRTFRFLTDVEFVEMMMLDSCFIIEYFLRINGSRGGDELIDNNYIRPIIEHDMLLLENQLPFFVVQSIYDLTMGENPPSLSGVILKFFNHSSFTQGTPFVNDEAKNIQHLLHFYHWFLVPAQIPSTPESREIAFKRVLERAAGRKKYALSIPSATVLASAGVKFKKRKGRFGLLGVRFHKGNMEIPSLLIDGFSKSLIKNIVAFEKFNPYIESQFTAYVKFLDHIINNSGDVALLCKNHIIKHALGSDEEVAHLFNSTGGSTFHHQPDYMKCLYEDVHTYCKNKWNKRRAILMSKYFDTPWSVLKFVAAVVVLVLAILQTFMAFYSYFHPST